MSRSNRTDREPCPWRIFDDAGGAFVFGIVGGTVWHMVGGARNAPSGQRFSQAIARTKARVPILGGSFAIWGTLFSCCDCTLTYIRKKEDPWNAIISGAASGGILAARAGMKAAGKSALAGGLILAAIEGMSILFPRVLLPLFQKQQLEGKVIDQLLPPVDPSRPRMIIKQPSSLNDRKDNANNMNTSQPSSILGNIFDNTTQNNGNYSNNNNENSWNATTTGQFVSTDNNKNDNNNQANSSWKLW